jgi:flagella basal body P-ring formation protein FlgA
MVSSGRFALETAATRSRKWRAELVSATLGALLLTTASAAAGGPAAWPSGPNRESTAGASVALPPKDSQVPDLAAQVAAQLTPLMPDGTRVQSVTLGCKPPAGATLKSVAPGFTKLLGRGFVVEFQNGAQVLVCSASLTAQRQVLVATHDIAAAEAVTERDFDPRWLDAFAGAIGALTEFPNRGPYGSTTFIGAGQPLYPNHLARPLAVHPGDFVSVLVRNGPVTVRTQLQAQSSAAIGENATLMNPDGGTPVTISVTGLKTGELVMQ